MKQKNTIYIGVGNQKGGVGKSTICEVLASAFAYRRGYNVLVVDCDNNQHSFSKLRERELNFLSQAFPEDHYRHNIKRKVEETISRRGGYYYPVVSTPISNALFVANEALSREYYDIIFFDLPGHCEEESILDLSLQMHYLLVPIENDTQSLVTSLSYSLSVFRLGVSAADYGVIRDVFILWNKINSTVRTNVVDEYNSIFKKNYEFTVLETVIPNKEAVKRGLVDAKEFKEIFRTTILSPPESSFSESHFKALLEELEEKMGLSASNGRDRDDIL